MNMPFCIGHLNQIFRDLASFIVFVRSPLKFKVDTIFPLIASFPHRKFVLVGDDGQQDPGTCYLITSFPQLKNAYLISLAEVYAQVAEAFPEQVLHIFIHHVNGTNIVRAAYSVVGPSPSS